MPNINDFTIEELRVLVVKQNKQLHAYKDELYKLNNSVKNWRESMIRWKANALRQKVKQDSGINVRVNVKGPYEGDEIIYRITTDISSEVRWPDIQKKFWNIDTLYILKHFPELNTFVRKKTNLRISKWFLGIDYWIIEIKEIESAKMNRNIYQKQEGYVLENEKLIREDLI